MPDDATSLSTHGWRQGSILPRPLNDELVERGQLPPSFSSGGIAVVISHDCDLLNPSLEKEPFVELITARRRQDDDGSLRHGKSPRRLLIDLEHGSDKHIFEASIHDRVRVERGVLLNHRPDSQRTITPESVGILVRWIVKRYYRAAFPDTFNERLRPGHKKFKKILSKGGAEISGIYLRVDDRELPPDEVYTVFAEATMPAMHYDDDASRLDAQECFDRLVAVMNDCDGIEVEEHFLVSEADFSQEEQRSLKRWDWDDLSLREDSGEIAEPV